MLRSAKLAAPQARKMAIGSGRENPSLWPKAIAKPISTSPAAARIIHAIRQLYLYVRTYAQVYYFTAVREGSADSEGVAGVARKLNPYALHLGEVVYSIDT